MGSGDEDVRALLPKGSRLLQFFTWEHLPPHLQAVSRPVGELAHLLDGALPDGPEKTAGMRKLLEAKDCFVRTLLDKAGPESAKIELPGERVLRVLHGAVMDKAGNAEMPADDYAHAVTWLHEQMRRLSGGTIA